MSGDREICLHAGMSDYMSKPFKVETLKEVLVRCAEHMKTADRVAQVA